MLPFRVSRGVIIVLGSTGVSIHVVPNGLQFVFSPCLGDLRDSIPLFGYTGDLTDFHPAVSSTTRIAAVCILVLGHA